MRSSSKKPKGANRTSTSSRSSASISSDRSGDSAQLRQIAKVMGNDHIRDALKGGSGHRDSMLAHVCARLKVLESAQGKEQLALGREREWFKGVASGKDGHHLPDLTRWHESARLYKKAGEALTQGHLGRGAQLLTQAAAAEQAAFDSAPDFVASEFEETETAVAAPEEAHAINDEASCSGCEAPKDLKIADKILSRSARMDKAPPLPRRKPAWFEEQVEEEEKKDDED